MFYTFIATFPHALPPVLSAQRLLFPISTSSLYIERLVEIVNKLNYQVRKLFTTKTTETQGSLVLFVPVALSYFLMNE